MTTNTKNFAPLRLEGQENIEIFCSCDGLSLQSLFFTMFKEFPNLYTYKTDEAHFSYHFNPIKIMEDLRKEYSAEEIQIVVYTIYNIQKNDEMVGINIFMPNKKIIARVENGANESYVLYGLGGENEVEKMTKIFLKHFEKPDLPPNNVYTVAADQGGFFLNKLPTKDFSNLDIDKNYNDDFVRENEKISKFIKTDDTSGLLILHGDKGTGKSTYIRHLISTNPERKFVYVPSSMVRILGEPNFSTFLMTLQNHVIILEDCEDAIKDRKANGTPAAVSLLLNLTDGLLSDGLGLKFICTFNDDVKNIDAALLRKGRLVSKYEFRPLPAEKANVLLNELYMEKYDSGEVDVRPETKQAMSLANIYNFYDDSYEKERRAII